LGQQLLVAVLIRGQVAQRGLHLHKLILPFPQTATTTYALTEANSNGCVNSNSVKITVNSLPAAGVNSNTSICTGTSITIGATVVSGSAYSWTSSPTGFTSTQANPYVSPTATTTYAFD